MDQDERSSQHDEAAGERAPGPPERAGPAAGAAGLSGAEPAEARVLAAVGDLHGHAPALERLLEALARDGRLFADGRPDRLREGALLVFTGDYVDRGRGALRIIERLRRLEADNPGQVVTLLGNHELMALEALDLARACQVLGALAPYARSRHAANGGFAFLLEFGDGPEEALASYVARLDREGDVGAWLRRLRPWFQARVAGRTFHFTHADLSRELLAGGLLGAYRQAVDARLALCSSRFSGTQEKYGHLLLTAADGTFWCREFSALDPGEASAAEALCRLAGADHLVTGHTVHDRVTCYGGRIFALDVGMAPPYGENTPQALVVDAGGASALSADGAVEHLVTFPT